MPGMHGIRLGRAADCRKKLGENKTAPVPLQKQYGCRKINWFSTASALYVESCHAGVNGAAAQLLLNSQQLLVLCNDSDTNAAIPAEIQEKIHSAKKILIQIYKDTDESSLRPYEAVVYAR